MIMESSGYFYIPSIFLFCHQVLIIQSSENLAVNKTTSQSSEFGFGWESSNAVNGQQACSSGVAHTALGRQSAWWQVDLGNLYEIKMIKIFYRDNNDFLLLFERLNGYSINIIDSQNKKWQCFKDEDIGQLPSSFTPIHICPHLGQYVEFSVERLPNKTYINYDNSGAVVNLCEFEVYGCPQSRYGNGDCNSFCSVGCLNSRCDPDNGHCNCSRHWTGDKCGQCVDGYFGDPCTLCPEGCVNGLCRKNDGYCTDGCKNSFFDDFCNQSCPANCKQNKCDRQTGDCSDGCRTGNFLGNRCNVCVNGVYGKDCDIACPVKCKNRLCDGKDGICIFGCVNGLYGKQCDIACPINCKLKVCDETEGICILGCKHENMNGNHCDGIRNTTEEQAFQIKSYIASIIAGVVTFINIVFIAVILVMYCKRRRSKDTVYENQKPLEWTQERMNQQDNYNMEQHQAVHYETLGLDDRGSVNTNSADSYTGLNVNTEGRC